MLWILANPCDSYGFARFETVEEAVLCIEKLTEMNIEADFARVSTFFVVLYTFIVDNSKAYHIFRNPLTADSSVLPIQRLQMSMFPTFPLT